MKKVIFGLVLLVVSIEGFAGDWTCDQPGGSYHCNGLLVDTIYLNLDSRRIYFGKSGATHFYPIGSATTWSDDAKAVYSLLLSAKATGTMVNTWAEDHEGFKKVIQIILMKD